MAKETRLDTAAEHGEPNRWAAREPQARPGRFGSPCSAAVSSLVSFAIRAVVVVLPYLFGSGTAAMVAVIVLAAGALFTVGLVLGLLHGRAPLRGGPPA